jgi:hypothetical protein
LTEQAAPVLLSWVAKAKVAPLAPASALGLRTTVLRRTTILAIAWPLYIQKLRILFLSDELLGSLSALGACGGNY